jgi:hypothetical protein
MYLFLKTIERSFSKINDACLAITSPFVESYRSWVVRESIEADGRVSVGFGMLLGKVHQSGCDALSLSYGINRQSVNNEYLVPMICPPNCSILGILVLVQNDDAANASGTSCCIKGVRSDVLFQGSTFGIYLVPLEDPLRFHVLDACPYEIHHRREILQCCFSNMHGCQLLAGEIGSGLEISLFAFPCLRYHLADTSIMNSQMIRNLFQSISMTHVSSINGYISL